MGLSDPTHDAQADAADAAPGGGSAAEEPLKDVLNPLILPANISTDDPRVQNELTRYLTDNWVPVIETDVDGPCSLPLRMDSDVPNLGKFSASRRMARTIYLSSAPLTHR